MVLYTFGMVIRSAEPLLTQQEAAQRLAVSERRITALRKNGDLTAYMDGHGGTLITMESVLRYQRWAGRGGRPYSAHMAFAALYLISGEAAPWITRQERYRLNGYLRAITADDIARLTRRRARTHGYWCPEVKLPQVRACIRASAATGDLADRFQLTRITTVEGYLPETAVDDVIGRYRLRRNTGQVNVRLHEARFLPEGRGAMPQGVCAADLSESNDPRERRAGLTILGELIDNFNRKGHRS